MPRFFPNLESLHRYTLELDLHSEALACQHCNQPGQWVSHGFVFRKQHMADPQPVAKRILCSNRHGRTGCGRTRQLYLDRIIPRLSHCALQVFVFLSALLAGGTVASAYHRATGILEPRNGYRWLTRCRHRLADFRRSLRPSASADPWCHRSRSLRLVLSTLHQVFTAPDTSDCLHYQRTLQIAFF